MHLQSDSRAGRGARRVDDRHHVVDGHRAFGVPSPQLGITLANDPARLARWDPGWQDARRDPWPSHNYNHLMEQPTIFYAIALTLALMGFGQRINY